MNTQAQALLHTPLYPVHVASGARMVPFAGWEMPLHYGSQLEEHLNTRQSASIFDVSHMGQIEAVGPNALALVQSIVARDVAPLHDGEACYTVLCLDDGGIMDDLIVSRLAPDRFLLVVNAAAYAKDVALMKAITRHLALADARLDPCAGAWVMLAVQGPKWVEVCGPVLGAGAWNALPPMKVARLEFEERELILSTTGYTGEPGMELHCPPELAMTLWNGFVRHGAHPAGLAARDTLRLEKGYALSGQDFTESNNPFEAGLGWVVDLDKSDYPGRETLARIKAQGVRRHFVGLLPEGSRIPRHGARVVIEGRPIGEVTSGGFAPSLRRPVALGYVLAPFARPGSEVEIDLGNTMLKASVTTRSFYPPHPPKSGH